MPEPQSVPLQIEQFAYMLLVFKDMQTKAGLQSCVVQSYVTKWISTFPLFVKSEHHNEPYSLSKLYLHSHMYNFGTP